MCWFFFKWGIAAAIVAVLVGFWYFRDTLDEEIRSKVETMLAERYPQLEVRVQSAHRIDGEGIVIRGLSFSERDASGPVSEIAHFEEVLLACRAELQDLISGDIDVRRVTVRRPTLRATRRRDGSWSIEKLFAESGEPSAVRPMSIENATIVVFDPLKYPSSTFTLREVNLLISPQPPTDDGAETWNRIEGSLSGELLGRVELTGAFESNLRRWRIGGRVGGLVVSPELAKSLPAPVSEWLQPLQSVRGNAAISFRVDHDATRDKPYWFDVETQVRRGRIDDRRLPYPLADVNGLVRLTHDGIEIDHLTARSGRTQFWLRGRQIGYGEAPPRSLNLQAQRLVLDQHLADVMPLLWQQAWNKFLPAGEINATMALEFDGKQWKPDLKVECTDVAFTYYKFPYRLENGRGTVTFKDNVVKSQLVAYSQGRPVQIDTEAVNPGPNGTGRFVAQAAALPIDNRLLQALPPKTRAVIESFAPQGTVGGYLISQRDSPNAAWQKHYVVDLQDVSVQYKPFPYPIQGIRGRLKGVNTTWVFENLIGVNDSAIIRGQGRLDPTSNGPEVTMHLTAESIPLDDELRNAMPAHLRNVWRQIKPNGVVDLTTQIRYLPAVRQLNLVVDADLSKNGIVIEPEFFPYRMENLRGRMVFRDGRADFEKLTATHGRSQFAADGVCEFRKDGSWSLQLSDIAVDRLRVDRELLSAIPAGLRNRLTALNFSGPVNLTGDLNLSQSDGPQTPVKSSWDMRFNTLQGRMESAIVVDQISGGVHLVGGFDGRQSVSRGWLDVDSLVYKDFQITDLQGPLFLSDNEMLMGAYAEPGRPGQPPRRITAQLYGGAVVADCRVALAEIPHFEVNAQVVDADMKRLSTEALSTERDLKGKVIADVRLQGNTRGAHTFKGGGTVQVSDGDVGQLPLVLSLFKILTVKPPNSKAFSRSDIKFQIKGNHIQFDHINFYGDAISLLGKGEMDLDKNIRMIFHPIVGNGQRNIPLVKPVLGLAGKQLVWIYVYGTFDNPKTAREALPGVKRAVEGLQAELEQPNVASPFRQATNWFEQLLPKRE